MPKKQKKLSSEARRNDALQQQLKWLKGIPDITPDTISIFISAFNLGWYSAQADITMHLAIRAKERREGN